MANDDYCSWRKINSNFEMGPICKIMNQYCDYVVMAVIICSMKRCVLVVWILYILQMY